MSACISRQGEYSSHVLGGTEFVCDRCGVVIESALFAEVAALRGRVATLTATIDDVRKLVDDSGPFTAGDGVRSFATLSWHDVKDVLDGPAAPSESPAEPPALDHGHLSWCAAVQSWNAPNRARCDCAGRIPYRQAAQPDDVDTELPEGTP